MLDGIFEQVTAAERCRKVAASATHVTSSGDQSSPITTALDDTIATPQSAGYSFSKRILRTPSSSRDRTTRTATPLGSHQLTETPATPLAQQLPQLYMIVFDEIDALGSQRQYDGVDSDDCDDECSSFSIVLCMQSFIRC